MVTEFLDSENKFGMCILNFSKTFYICAELAALKIYTQMVGWVRSFLTNFSFQACIASIDSEDAAILRDVL